METDTHSLELNGMPAEPYSAEWYRELAERLWANGDESHAVFAHARAQELEARAGRVGERVSG